MRTSNANSPAAAPVPPLVYVGVGAILIAATIITAPAEYQLALVASTPHYFAAAFPAITTLYTAVSLGLRSRADSAISVALMALSQVLAGLLSADLITANGIVVTTVTLIPVAILARSGHILLIAIIAASHQPAPAATSSPSDAEPPATGPAFPVSARTTHLLPWPTFRSETVLADLATAPAEATSATEPSRRKTREQRRADLNAIILKRPTVDQTTAADEMGVSDRYIRRLVPGGWEDYRASIVAAV